MSRLNRICHLVVDLALPVVAVPHLHLSTNTIDAGPLEVTVLAAMDTATGNEARVAATTTNVRSTGHRLVVRWRTTRHRRRGAVMMTPTDGTIPRRHRTLTPTDDLPTIALPGSSPPGRQHTHGTRGRAVATLLVTMIEELVTGKSSLLLLCLASRYASASLVTNRP